MSAYPYHEDYYTAMVTAASNYPDASGQRILPSPAFGAVPHGRSSTFSSANSSTSTGSNNAGVPRYAAYRPGCQRLPTNASASGVAAGQNASTHSTNTSLSGTTTKTYTHNPYGALITGPTSKDTSFNASLDSYQSFQATYGDTTFHSSGYPRYPGFLHHHHQQPQQQQQAYLCNPVCQPQRQRGHKIAVTMARGGSGLFQASPQTMGGDQPVYAPTSGDSRAESSNTTEQFVAAIGSLAPTACSARGRHLLISVLRMQHLDKIELIYEELLPRINTVALDPQGCHVVRTLIEFISSQQLAGLVPALLPKTILDMATSTQNTRRALQSMFERHQTSALTPVVQVVASDSQRLATTQQGCIAVMRILEHGLPEQRQLLVASLLPVLPALTMDPYGNYVVQCMLDNLSDSYSIEDVCEAFAEHWVPLSCNKFASNVMEKVVRRMPADNRAGLVAELVYEPTNLHSLMQDGFGNFVLQAIIASSTDSEEFDRVYALVEELVHASPYGHKIDAKLRGKYSSIHGKEPPRSKLGKEPKA